MLFSHRISDVLDEPTRSGMKVGQLCGHSCLSIWTSVRLSLLMNTFSRAMVSSVWDMAMTFPTTYDLIPSRCSGGKIFHLKWQGMNMNEALVSIGRHWSLHVLYEMKKCHLFFENGSKN